MLFNNMYFLYTFWRLPCIMASSFLGSSNLISVISAYLKGALPQLASLFTGSYWDGYGTCWSLPTHPDQASSQNFGLTLGQLTPTTSLCTLDQISLMLPGYSTNIENLVRPPTAICHFLGTSLEYKTQHMAPTLPNPLSTGLLRGICKPICQDKAA